MTTLNTIIEEEKKKASNQSTDPANCMGGDVLELDRVKKLLTTAMQRAYEVGRTDSLAKIPMLRQWLNEDKITDVNRMVTNEQIRYWLIGEE